MRTARSIKDGRAHKLPAFDYYLDESDPDVVILRLQDGSLVAAFSASGATREGILEAAKEDYLERLRAHVARQGQGIEEQRTPPERLTLDGPYSPKRLEEGCFPNLLCAAFSEFRIAPPQHT